MDELKMERTIRETLKNSAEGLEAPDRLKTRIDFALRSGETQVPVRRRPKWGKKLAAVCLVAALAVTGAVAGSGVVGWYSSTMLNQNWTDFAETAEYVQEHVPGAKYVASFSNGYTFDKGYEDTVDKRDDSGNTLGSCAGGPACVLLRCGPIPLHTGEPAARRGARLRQMGRSQAAQRQVS